jgi:hypothetical protein
VTNILFLPSKVGSGHDHMEVATIHESKHTVYYHNLPLVLIRTSVAKFLMDKGWGYGD